MSRDDDDLAEVERIEHLLREGDWVRPAPHATSSRADPRVVVRRADRRPWRTGLVAAAAVAGVVLGGVGLAQIVAPRDAAAPASPASPPSGATAAQELDGTADPPGPDHPTGSLLVTDVRDVAVIERDPNMFGRSSDGPSDIVFTATIENASARAASRSECYATATQIRRLPLLTDDTRESLPGIRVDCFNGLSLEPGESFADDRMNARVPTSDDAALGESVRWFLPEHPESAVTFVMSDDAPLRVIGVLTIEKLPTEESDAFTLAYENLTDRPIEGFRCAPTVQEPPDGRRVPGEAYVDTSPFVDCVGTTVSAGQQARERVDLDLPEGTERVRVVGPEGSEIVVPLVREK